MIGHRVMGLPDLEAVLDWAAAEGWNPGLDDAVAFLAADPEGFFLAEEDGVPVAAISVVNHGPDFAFLGLYLCRPEYRGRGIGYALWRHALDHAGSRTVGLDGVQEQQANYERSGFVRAGETIRYTGRLPAGRDGAISAAVEADIPALVEMEAVASGWRKHLYLSHWFRSAPHRVTLVHAGDGGPRGVATVRRCREGAKIGPLVAETPEIARALISHAAAEFGDLITLDVPSSSGRLDAMCRELGFAPGFQTARMYRGPARAPSSDLFSVATLELG